jgi:N-acyl-phosphatidylethanolamine-hydrolysing phospholipase D
MAIKSNETYPLRRFINPFEDKIRKHLFHFLLWKLGYYKELLPCDSFEESFVYPVQLPSFDEKLPSCVWINHSSFLIELAGVSVLTDPVFSSYCSPIPRIGPKRLHEPPFRIEDLSKVDVVLISHNHYDHLDKKSVMALFQRFPKILWVVPTKLKKWFTKLGIENVVQLSWWESFSQNRVKISSVPAQHFSGRYLFDLNHTLWSGYVVEVGHKRFYFSGDTGYNAFDFKKIGERWGSIDLSLIPIGAYSPRKFMKPVHVNPTEAVEIHQDVRSKLSIGMHWKTFRLSEEPIKRPPFDLFLAMKEAKLDPKSFIAIEPGIYVNW